MEKPGHVTAKPPDTNFAIKISKTFLTSRAVQDALVSRAIALLADYLKLMEKNGYIYRESAKQDARLKQIIPTEKAEKIRSAILKSIEEGEAKMLRGIPKEDVELCKQVLWQMYENRKKSCDSRNDF